MSNEIDALNRVTRLDKRWLDNQVQKAQQGAFGRLGRLTPGIADILLSRNHGNRAISRPVVARMARDILAGAWVENGETIIVSDTGELNDGQHRCAAVVEACKTIVTAFWFGATRDSRETVNVGRARSTQDVLEIRGTERARTLAPCCSWLWQFEQTGTIGPGSRSVPTKQEQLRYLDEHPDLAESAELVDQPAVRKLGGKPLLATAHYLLARVAREEADVFNQRLINGADLRANGPLHRAREVLLDIQNGLSASARRTPAARLEIIIRAWNNHRSGKPGGKLGVTGTIPEVR